MWVVDSSKENAVNMNNIDLLSVLPIDADYKWVYDEDDADEIMGYVVCNKSQILGGPYKKESTAKDEMINIICNIGRVAAGEPYYCAPPDIAPEKKNG